MKNEDNDLLMDNRVFLGIVAAAALVLLIPWIAMQFSAEVAWTLSDFITMGVLLIGSGSLFVLIARRVDRKYRILVGLAVAAAMLFVWAELAVGIFTNWGS